jgi:hypothetical protein
MKTMLLRTRGRRGLLVLNAALLAALVLLTWGPAAIGQNAQPAGGGGGARARGDYTMVAGKTIAGGPSAVYIVDSSNQELVALRWDQSKQQMVGMGYRNLQGDARAIPGR